MLDQRLIDQLRAKIASSTVHGEPIQLRRYQMDASVESVVHLLRRENVIVDLPTGTGKTMIANMATYLWRKTRTCSRVLYVVPRRVLVAQHVEHARWLSPDSFALGIHRDLMRNAGRYHSSLVTYHIYVTTPALFAASVKDLRTDPAVFSKIDLVIVDEFDEFLLLEYQQYGTGVRFKRHLESLRRLFGRDVRFMLMSATSPLRALERGSRDDAVQGFSEFVVSQFKPHHVVEINESHYSTHVPTARVRLVNVQDKYVVGMALALQTEIAFAFRDYTCETQIELEPDFLYPRLDKIMYGGIQHVRTVSGGWTIADEEVKSLCRKLRTILNKNNFLFEDLFQGFHSHVDRRPIVCRDELNVDNGKPKFGDVRVLVDSRTDDEYHPRLRGKFDSLQRIIRSRPQDKGVIFTRYIRLSDAICRKLDDMGVSYVEVHGQVKGTEVDKRLEQFRAGTVRVLVITRDTGKRGLDLPKADYAIFYSPKASERTVWQEVSRIRSTIHRTKDSYFLVYRGTSEEKKANDLAWQMAVSGREYEILSHDGVDLLKYPEDTCAPA